MFTPTQYELLDFGGGRKLERFGEFVLDRPAPAADGVAKSQAAAWREAAARFDESWMPAGALPECWSIQYDSVQFQIKPTPAGQVGVFPEQAANWDWIARHVEAAERPIKVLNLFAYTGGSTLAAARAGAEVVHVDAARTVVRWAQTNAELSNLGDAPIRWITEDAGKFVAREMRRGNRYDAVVLDPPSYGHGPKGEAWKIDERLPPLLDACATLTGDAPAFVLLTCHSPGYDAAHLQDLLAARWPPRRGFAIESGPLVLRDLCGRELSSGMVARGQCNRRH